MVGNVPTVVALFTSKYLRYFNTKQLTLLKIVKTVISITTDNVTVHIFVFSLSVFFS